MINSCRCQQNFMRKSLNMSFICPCYCDMKYAYVRQTSVPSQAPTQGNQRFEKYMYEFAEPGWPSGHSHQSLAELFWQIESSSPIFAKIRYLFIQRIPTSELTKTTNIFCGIESAELNKFQWHNFSKESYSSFTCTIKQKRAFSLMLY